VLQHRRRTGNCLRSIERERRGSVVGKTEDALTSIRSLRERRKCSARWGWDVEQEREQEGVVDPRICQRNFAASNETWAADFARAWPIAGGERGDFADPCSIHQRNGGEEIRHLRRRHERSHPSGALRELS